MIGKGKSISHGVAALEYDLAKEIDGQAAATEIARHAESEPAACSRTGISRIEARGSLYETHRGRNSQKGTDRRGEP